MSRNRRLTGAPTAGAEGACATQFVDVCWEDRLQRGDSVAVALGRRRNGAQRIKSVPSMALSNVRRYPQGSHISDANTKAGGRKRRALEEKNSKTNDVHSRKTSTEAKQRGKVKLSTPIHKRKAQSVKAEAATTYEGFRGRTSKKTGGIRDASATKEKQTKQEAASSTKENDKSTEIDGLFLAHREKALHTGKYLGAHISAAGGPQNAPVNCLNVGGQAFAFFLKNQRRWESPPISEESARAFKNKVESFGLGGPEHILPHGSYLINLANPDPAKRKTSYDAFLDDLRRCEKLGIQRYVFHPGSTVGACGKSEGIANVAFCLNEAMAATQRVTILLENMAGQKNVLCSTFEDLRDIIEKIERKDRVGVCLDTCHLFAAGFDIRTPDGFETVMKRFDAVVGIKYLKGMHINDSKSDLSSGLDRHEHLGKGTIGIAAFKYIMQHPHWFKNMPLIIETPEDGNAMAVWRDEIKRLYEFIDV